MDFEQDLLNLQQKKKMKMEQSTSKFTLKF